MIFGLSALQDTETNEYLKAFYSHSTEHPHGWGQAVLRQDSALIEKESLEASKSNYLRERLSVPVRARLLLAHIRYATRAVKVFQRADRGDGLRAYFALPAGPDQCRAAGKAAFL